MSVDSQFIGRGENLTVQIIERLFPNSTTWTQAPIWSQILDQDFQVYGEEFSKHKFDIVSKVKDSLGKIKTLVIEVNYKHGEKSAKKWRETFAPDLIRNGKIPVTIDDYDCREKGLFYLNSKKEHVASWDDFRDVIDQLEKAGVTP